MHQVITDTQKVMAGLWADSMALFVTDVVPEMFALSSYDRLLGVLVWLLSGLITSRRLLILCI